MQLKIPAHIKTKIYRKRHFFVQANGFKYVGDYDNDKKHGKGKYTYPNGDIYNGQWKNGVRNGKGKYSYKEDEGV